MVQIAQHVTMADLHSSSMLLALSVRVGAQVKMGEMYHVPTRAETPFVLSYFCSALVNIPRVKSPSSRRDNGTEYLPSSAHRNSSLISLPMSMHVLTRLFASTSGETS